ncbi:hypothetical protein AGDE_04689 [Angomonas deanei]|nr:hypothetical protein AGDE_04689 [Angomonas deanei]|eukprot:EPY39239.1 hypothetical protein AGDE_04689 [Angomonas deanei]
MEPAFEYLGDAVIYNTWLGVVEGKENVINFLRDNIRFLYYNKSMNDWKQVQHSLDPGLSLINGRPFSDAGYDSQGFAMFEREGKLSGYTGFTLSRESIRETVVVKGNKIMLVSLSKRM